MNIKTTEEELDLAVHEFEKTLKAFEKAAKKLMSIMDSMNEKRHQELKALTGESQRIYEFLVQMMDDSGEVGEKCFGIRCVAEKKKTKSKN